MKYTNLNVGGRMARIGRFLVNGKHSVLSRSVPGMCLAITARVRAADSEKGRKKQAMIEQTRHNAEAVAAVAAFRFNR